MFALTTPSTTDNQASPTNANLDITQITTIIDRPMIIRGTGVSRAYHAEITGVEAEERIRRHEGRRYQIVRMADGSEFAFPAAPCEIDILHFMAHFSIIVSLLTVSSSV